MYSPLGRLFSDLTAQNNLKALPAHRRHGRRRNTPGPVPKLNDIYYAIKNAFSYLCA
jgi:hypothetical protein